MLGVSVKPLSATQATELLTRYDRVQGGELHAVRLGSATRVTLVFGVQDRHRGFDWIDWILEIDGVADARLPEQTAHLDFEAGVTLVFEGGQCSIAVGEYGRLEALRDAPLYVIGTSMKWDEAPFETA